MWQYTENTDQKKVICFELLVTVKSKPCKMLVISSHKNLQLNIFIPYSVAVLVFSGM